MMRRWPTIAIALLASALGFQVLRPQSTAIRDGRRYAKDDDRGAEYYKGMVTSDLSGEEGKDMLTPTLKLAAGTTGLLAVLVALFFAANAGL